MIKLADFNDGIRSAEMLTDGQIEMIRARQEVIITVIRSMLREREHPDADSGDY